MQERRAFLEVLYRHGMLNQKVLRNLTLCETIYRWVYIDKRKQIDSFDRLSNDENISRNMIYRIWVRHTRRFEG